MKPRAVSQANPSQIADLSPQVDGTAAADPSKVPWWKSRPLYVRVAKPALLLYCLIAALSVALTQILLIPLLLYWLTVAICSPAPESKQRLPLSRPVLGWFFVCLLSAFWGADAVHSGSEVLKGSIFLLLPFAVSSAVLWAGESQDEKNLSRAAWLFGQFLAAFAAGQTIAAVSTVLGSGVGLHIPDGLPGPLTESGQLVFILPLVIGVLVAARRKARRTETAFPSARWELLAAGILLLSWASGVSAGAQFFAGVIAAVFLLARLFQHGEIVRRQYLAGTLSLNADAVKLVKIAGLLLAAAFLFNLKRGPWLGVFLEVVLFGVLFSRHLVLWAVGGCLAVLLLLSPVRSRLQDSADDFAIQGGRQNMWTLGGELLQSFPLGIGFGNSRLMRVLDPTLPKSHRHMHNNILQVGVETGWLGLGIYLWWMAAVYLLGWRIWQRRGTLPQETAARALIIMAVSCGAALLGWQCAGIVEYNFGDAEIRTIAFFYMGILIGIEQVLLRHERGQKHSSS